MKIGDVLSRYLLHTGSHVSTIMEQLFCQYSMEIIPCVSQHVPLFQRREWGGSVHSAEVFRTEQEPEGILEDGIVIAEGVIPDQCTSETETPQLTFPDGTVEFVSSDNDPGPESESDVRLHGSDVVGGPSTDHRGIPIPMPNRSKRLNSGHFNIDIHVKGFSGTAP